MSKRSQDSLWLNDKDNIVVALRHLAKGDVIEAADGSVTVNENIKMGHKIAIIPIPKYGMVIKYGEEIGEASADINVGDHVHVHNVRDITLEVFRKKKKELGL
ncbi:MAG: hypothetical protein A2029_17165 [Chloroflexi bacterium RBG_19FT_COMBO_47_9]|nr:MAG: hypothetical protein A2029_17165 [Chloroflexi bacterium RBG_19FT_COMBO_47_9]